MYYKNNNSIGIRRKFGQKEQCFSFGGKKCSMTETQLRGFGDDAMRKIDQGMSEADVKIWARAATQDAS